jgi:hypothetical protein
MGGGDPGHAGAYDPRHAGGGPVSFDGGGGGGMLNPGGNDPRAAEEAKQDAFRRDLDEQVRLKKERVQREKDEVTRRERIKDAEIAEYDPWGKGGGGAPLRDAGGNVHADLRGVDIHASNQKQNQHQHSPGRGGYQGGHQGGGGGYHGGGDGGGGGQHHGGGAGDSIHADIPGMPRRGVAPGQGDYSSPLRRAGGGPSSFRLDGGDPNAGGGPGGSFMGMGGGAEPPTPGGVNSLVAGPSAAQMTQQEISRRQLVADLDEQVRAKKEVERQRKAKEDAQDAKEEMRIKAAIEAEQRAVVKEAPAFSDFPDESENINNNVGGGGGGGGGNRGRVANSPPPPMRGPPEPTLARGGGVNISHFGGGGGGGNDASRRKLGYAGIPGLENHNPAGAGGASAPSTPPPNAQRSRTPSRAPRTPDPALRSMVDNLQQEQQRLRTEIEAQARELKDVQLEAQRLARERDLAERERDLEQQLNKIKVEMGGSFGPGGGMSPGARGVMLPLQHGAGLVMPPPAAGSFEFGVSPRDQSGTVGAAMMGPGMDSHRSFAGALDGIGGGDPLDGFVVHSRFVRGGAVQVEIQLTHSLKAAWWFQSFSLSSEKLVFQAFAFKTHLVPLRRVDAPIGEGEGGGLVPQGVTVDPEQFRAINGGGWAVHVAFSSPTACKRLASFNPCLRLCIDKLDFHKTCSFEFNLYRYATAATGRGAWRRGEGGARTGDRRALTRRGRIITEPNRRI